MGSTQAAIPGLIVTVVGTSINSRVDASNRFSLSNVPGGDIQLQFTAPAGINAGLGVPGVRNSERIAVTVSLSGTTAVLESQTRSAGSEEQLEGRIESLPPTTPALTLIVAGRTVTATASTVVRHGETASDFSALAIGQRVHVKGVASGTSLVANEIKIQNTNVDIPVELNGTVLGFTGVAGSFQFTIDGRLVMADATTTFFGNSAFSDLANGRRAVVKGLQRDGFVLATSIHVNNDGGGPGPAPGPVVLDGAAGGLKGSCPSLTFKVHGVDVFTNAATVFTPGCSGLKSGNKVIVNGVVEAGGTVRAVSVAKQ
jgi:hypothetical protein